MKHITKKTFSPLAVPLLVAVFTLAGCLSGADGREGGAYLGAVSYKLVVEGFEWGPAVTKLILTAEEDFRLDGSDKDAFVVKTTQPGMNGEPAEYVRRITDLYICAPDGTRLSSGSSRSIAFDLATGYAIFMTIPGVGDIGGAIDGSSPFSYNMETGFNS
jgi:hypothetical protein